MDATRKVKNPLLFAAGHEYTDDFMSGNLIVPVTPATPAVLSDENDPPKGEVDTFLGQTFTDVSLGPPVSEEPKEPPLNQPLNQPPKQQGYFTSILSSFPNLSLSARAQEPSYQPSSHQEPPVAAPFYGGHKPEVQTNPVNQPPPFYSPSLPPRASPGPPPQSQGPSIPPSGGPGSYRLGNQRRLKYAPPPDLTASSKQPSRPDPSLSQFQAPPPIQNYFVPTVSIGAVTQSTPSTYFNPTSNFASFPAGNPPTSVPPPQPQIPTYPGLQNSKPAYYQHPVPPQPTPHNIIEPPYLAVCPPKPATSNNVIEPPYLAVCPPKPPTPDQNLSRVPTELPHPFVAICPAKIPTSQPQSIPSQIAVPATPQNTPANFSFAGLQEYQNQVENSRLNSYFDQNTFVPKTEPSYEPISAEQVSEKLEHLIAERKTETEKQVIEIKNQGPVELKEKTILKEEPSTGNYFDSPFDQKDLLRTSSQSSGTQKPTDQTSLPQSSLGNYFSEQAPRFSGEQFSSEQFSKEQFPSEQFSQSASEKTVEEKPESLSEVPLAAPEEKCATELREVDLKEVPLEPVSSLSSCFDDQPALLDTSTISTTQNYFYPTSGVPQFHNLNENTFLTGPSIQPQTTFIRHDNYVTTAVPQLTSPFGGSGYSVPDTVPPSLQNLASAGTSERRMQYRPVYHHWFYRKEIESKTVWRPFSMQDSLKLEEVYNLNDSDQETRVATDGGRYDVDIVSRERSPVYWSEDANEVRRCSWFYKGAADSRYTPYEESLAARLEEEYKQGCSTNSWNRKLELGSGEHIILHSSTLQMHYLQPSTPDLGGSWSTPVGSEESPYLQGTAGRPRMVKRGVDEFTIEDGEPEKVDHLLFLVHGIGSVCDLKFRSVEEVVDEFRSISLQLVQSHYKTAHENGLVNRIEVLPISWHATLHSEDTGIDNKLKAITLESIPKLRHFTNDTLLDILFYTSPIFCQTIMQTVGQELNRLFSMFNERNPQFSGEIYLGGHSLGSLILFDLLCHQRLPVAPKVSQEEENDNDFEDNDMDNLGPMKKLPVTMRTRRLSRKVSYVMGSAGTGQPYINYPQLNFNPRAFFALGSPIGMFVTIRGIDTLGENFALPTCPSFFNIFHPFDPVAYRVESLINPEAAKYRPKLIPHHKGRKRMHLELKETMARVGADLKQKLLDSVRSTWNSVYQLAMFHKPDNQTLEQEINKVVEEQLKKPPTNPEPQPDDGGNDIKIGKLNGGRRVDYVLQEAPFEYINEYIFALTSHVCYWESEDTMLLILKEIYSSMGIQTDTQLPQQSLSIERPATPTLASPSSSVTTPASGGRSPVLGMDPTAPIGNVAVGPPPTSGFVRKPNSQPKSPEFQTH